MTQSNKIYVAGHRGMVGSAIVRVLKNQGQTNLDMRTHADLALAIAQAVGYKGTIEFDATKPDGTPRKWMDSSRLNALGWQAKVSLIEGLSVAYQDFVMPRTYWLF